MRRAAALAALLLAAGGPARALLAPVTGLTTRAGDGWAVVAWAPDLLESTQFVTRYLLWRSDDGGTTTILVATVAADTVAPQSGTDTRSYWDVGLPNGLDEQYVVEADALSGTVLMDSGLTGPVDVVPMTTTMFTDPAFNGGLAHDRPVAFETGNAFVRFLWNPTASLGETEVSQYRIARATGPAGPFSLVTANAPNGGVYTDTSLVNGQVYWYMITPQLPDRCPVFLPATPYLPARGDTPPLARTDPAGPRAVRIAWEPAIAGTYASWTITGAAVSAYAIYRSDNGGSTTILVGTVPGTQLYFIDLTVPTYGKRYLYLVRPIDAQGHLGDSYPTAIIDVILPINRTYLGRNAFRPDRGEVEPVIFQVTEAGRVRVTVMTQTGELVRRLLDRDVQGTFTADTPFNSRDRGLPPLLWDGTNDHGEVVGSGAYFVVLEVNGKRDFRTCAVIR